MFAVRAASGAGNRVTGTPVFEMPVDKPRAVIAVDTVAGQGEGRKRLQGLFAGLVFEGAELGPAEGDVGEAYGVGVFVLGRVSVGGNGVNLGETGLFIVSLPACPQRDVLFQKGFRFGSAGPLGLALFSLAPEHKAAYCRRLDLGLWGQFANSASRYWRQALAADALKEAPDGPEGPFRNNPGTPACGASWR